MMVGGGDEEEDVISVDVSEASEVSVWDEVNGASRASEGGGAVAAVRGSSSLVVLVVFVLLVSAPSALAELDSARVSAAAGRMG